MREFSKISPAVWHSPRFNSLPSDDGRDLYLYLLSSPHQTSAGAYHLPEGYACADLRWPEGRYRQARDQLITADLITFDADTEAVMIKRWFKHNPPKNEKHYRGIIQMIARLSSATTRQAASEAVHEVWQGNHSKVEAQEKSAGAASRVLETAYLNGRQRKC